MKRSENGPAQFDSADRLADAIIARVGKTIVLAMPLGLGKANHVANVLYARAVADSSIRLRIFTALTLEKPHPASELERRFLGPIAERCFGGYPDLAYAAALRKGLPPNIEVDEFFFQAGSRLNVPAAQQSYISANYTHALGAVLQRGVNVVGQLVAKRVRDGTTRYSLSCNPDITLDLLALRQSRAADFVFVGQVNSELPFMPGEGDLGAEAFDMILESPPTDFPLFAPPREAVDLAEYAAGLRVAGIVADGGTLQLGIGALGDAVAQALVLRHKNNARFRGLLARLDAGATAPAGMIEERPFEVGLYGASEMFVEGFLDLFHAGILRREVEGALLHAAFFVGSRAFYRALREMPKAALEKFRMSAVSYVNELWRHRLRRARERPGRQRRRGAIQFRGAGLCPAGCPIHHHAAGNAQRRRTRELQHSLAIRAHHDPASSARHRGDRIRRCGSAREDRSGRDCGHAGGGGCALPGRAAAAGQGCRQDRAALRAAARLARQHSATDRAGFGGRAR
jgi:hypothetical protein